MKRAAIYARVSRAYKEDDDRITIELQLADCAAYCQERGYTVVNQYVDKDKYRAKRRLVQSFRYSQRSDRVYAAMLKAARAG
jgi:DNA invertase Pin-like site-specific DNA recombinase